MDIEDIYRQLGRPVPAHMRQYINSPTQEEPMSYSREPSRNPFLSKKAITIYLLIAGLLILLMVNPWKRVTTPAGMVTVVTDTPFFFGKGGVRPEVLQPGAEWIWRTTQTSAQSPKPFVIPVIVDDFASAENNMMDFESNVTVQVTDWAKMYDKFGVKWWTDNLNRPYLDMVREQVKGHPMAKLMSDTGTTTAIDNALTEKLTKKAAELGLPVRIVEISMGRAKPNAEVLREMNNTAAQQQRAITYAQAKLAEDAREKSEEQRAIADNAYRNKIGLDTSEFVQLQLADKQVEACRAAKECVILPPGTSTVVGR